MKIVHLTSVHSPLDVRILFKEAITLAAAGHEVVLIAHGERDTTIQGVSIRSLKRVASRRQRMITAVLAVLRTALAERGDVYHFHDPELIPAGLWLKAVGKQVIYDVHEDLPAQVLNKFWIRRPLRAPVAKVVGVFEQMVARLFDGIIVANPPHRGRFPQGKTEVVRNLPILEEFADGASVPYAARAPVIVYAGGLTEARGVKEMVRAMSLLPEASEARLRLAGLFMEPGLEAVCQTLQGWDRVDVLGWLSRREIATLLSRARVGLVLLHPVVQYQTPYPVKLFEYMAAGLPVVASDLPPSRELIEDAGCGLLVEPLSPAGAAEAIHWLLEHPDEAEEMGRRGRRAVEERYNWRSEGQKLVRYYERFGRREGRGPTPAPIKARKTR